MKYRIMVEGEKEVDFDEKEEVKARAYGLERKNATAKKKTLEGTRPKVTIHECHNDDGGRCINWEEV